MKKNIFRCLSVFALLSMAMPAMAGVNDKNPYQLQNGGFEEWKDKEPSPGWNSFPSAGGSLAGIAKSGLDPIKVEGRSGYAVQIKSVSKMGVGANGNLTTGRINAGSMAAAGSNNYNYTDISNDKYNTAIEGQPDALSFYSKFQAASNNKNGCGHVQIYLHGAVNFKDPADKSQASYKIAAGDANITPSSDWVYYEVPLQYSKSVKDVEGKIYALVNFTTNPTPGGSSGDVLTLDDVALIYNSEMTGLKYNGKAVEEKDIVMPVGESFDVSKLEVTTNARAAIVEKEIDATGKLVITVKGQDYEKNPTNVHTYEYQVHQSLMFAATGDYQTLSLNYNATVPAGVSIYSAEFNNDETRINLTEENVGVLAANTGVLVMAAKGKEYKFESTSKSADNVSANNILRPTGDGNQTLASLEENSIYLLAKKGDSEAAFYQYTANKMLPANKAYIRWNSSKKAPARISVGFDDADAISSVEASEQKAEYYDLSGRRITKPNQRGVVIQKTENGSRVVIR